jgi:hypothetical protein
VSTSCRCGVGMGRSRFVNLARARKLQASPAHDDYHTGWQAGRKDLRPTALHHRHPLKYQVAWRA